MDLGCRTSNLERKANVSLFLFIYLEKGLLCVLGVLNLVEFYYFGSISLDKVINFMSFVRGIRVFYMIGHILKNSH